MDILCLNQSRYFQAFLARGDRTTKATPRAVTAVPNKVVTVIISSNSSQAMMAVVGGTK
jgi:hypothetical protein